MEWMDTLRGSAILLMLFWHATSLPNLRGMPVPAALLSINDFFLPFRMPTLMFLSGMLLPRALTKPVLVYLRGKLSLIAWPWFVWMVAYRITDGSTWALVHPSTYVARGYMWFLFFLCVYYAVAPIVRRLPPWVMPLVLLAGSFAFTPASSVNHRLLYFGIFFFAGAWATHLGPGFMRRVTRPRSVVVLAVPALALGLASALTDLAYESLYVPASFAGILVAVAAASRLPSRLTSPVRYVGRNSIVYYTAHFPAMVGVLWPFVHAGTHVAVVVPSLMLAGLAIGTLFSHWRSVIPIRWLFEMPGLPPVRQAAGKVPA
ncbi:acyltransferase family protein [Isoptericola sp. b441]|uniref:Acyltransferase family protein n=2 Tax=Actinotalea lenta TaxID=3064654 RepID=A0ABT9D7J0_9CELL|nr:acyltransferase family protein [Isoptericola sp. b441]MDO8106814.1 acyltransferase family protein [Isoptericola sp. b441]MDO8121475.1 acyltransferase family protein [Isoptericola sp. b490]